MTKIFLLLFSVWVVLQLPMYWQPTIKDVLPGTLSHSHTPSTSPATSPPPKNRPIQSTQPPELHLSSTMEPDSKKSFKLSKVFTAPPLRFAPKLEQMSRDYTSLDEIQEEPKVISSTKCVFSDKISSQNVATFIFATYRFGFVLTIYSTCTIGGPVKEYHSFRW